MATEPKRPDDGDNIVSLREARARQAEAQAKADKGKSDNSKSGKNKSGKNKSGKNKSGTRPEMKVPALLIFLSLLAILVAFKFLT